MASENSRNKEAIEQEETKEALNLLKVAALGAGIVIAAGLLGWGTSKLFSAPSVNLCGGVTEKLMKAPGRNGEYISRTTFENDPSAYFEKLHLEKKKWSN